MERKSTQTQEHLPDARECAVLLMLLLATKTEESGKEGARARLSEITLKQLWSRHRLRDELLQEVQEWLFRAGWALFYSGTTFAIVKTSSVDGWPRVTYKRLAPEIEQARRGAFDYHAHEHLLRGDNADDDADD